MKARRVLSSLNLGTTATLRSVSTLNNKSSSIGFWRLASCSTLLHHENKNFIQARKFNQQPPISSSSQTNSINTTTTTTTSWPQKFVESAPSSIRPYLYLMRLDKPIGTWLLLYPCLWSLAFADVASLIPSIYYSALFAIGAIIMRGAGCTVNDMWDRDFDKQVERTKTRPIASGQISMKNATIFLGAQLLAGLAVLVQFNYYTIAVGASSLFFVFTYPLMKRFTYWPQSYLGLTFNWGIFVGYAAFAGFCNWSILVPMYLGSIAWTLVYDTIYAHQDKKDDRDIGVKSTALLFGDRTREILTGFSLLFGVCASLAGHNAGYDMIEQWPYFLAIFSSVLGSIYKIHTIDYNNSQQCMKTFVQNKWVGFVILLGIIGANWTKRRREKQPTQQ
ncbi:hypothetical protein C9374_011196 [Naegleria lovaniensis]|uniref:4-hydroxybenzoate polyprenyltransferase, mitochondrial n=1 Tax=Naegleria lovaniensis TaxID=51637 RepID=A0AA88GA64_NAELO|nr:uncharacterized protein C9374_011196 [Naegleria lovaniensis]KAG2374117.1 hypothetical protein C9374_011196 [Naegleria lovaniensis]